MNEFEANAAIRHWLRVQGELATHFVTLKVPDRKIQTFRPDVETREAFRDLIVEWLVRLNRKCYGRGTKRRTAARRFRFMAFPESRGRDGNPVPLHYHVLFGLNAEQAKLLVDYGQAEWLKLCSSNDPDMFHLIQVVEPDPTSAYCTKQAGDEGQLTYVVMPEDLDGRLRGREDR